MTRPDREDLTRQTAAVDEARMEMHYAADAVHVEARYLARILGSKSRIVSAEALTDLTTALAGAMSAFRRAEDSYSTALVDLTTARGEDL